MKKLSLTLLRLTAVFATGILFAAKPALAQQPRVFASGLLNPLKVIVGPSGTLLTAEADREPNTGRVSVIDPTGMRRTLIDRLPSGISGPDPDGPTGLLLENNLLFVTIGEGNLYTRGTTPGTMIINPAGPASPAFDCVLRFRFSRPIDRIQGPFILALEDHFTLVDGYTVILSNGAGDTAAVSMVAAFRFRPDPQTIFRNSHPFGLARLDWDRNSLYLVNAGLNSLVQVNQQTGRARTVARFAAVPNSTGIGPALTDAVPTSVRAFENRLLVTLYSGFPFGPLNSKVVAVNPLTGVVSPFMDGLSTAIDILQRPRLFSRSQFLVLEYSADRTVTPMAPGRLLAISASSGNETPSSEVVVSGLNAPTSMALDETTGKLYITSFRDGTVLEIDLRF